jgi:hypothetical protein
MIKPFLLALADTTKDDEVVTLAFVGVEAVKGVFVLTIPLCDDEPIPGFCTSLYKFNLKFLIISSLSFKDVSLMSTSFSLFDTSFSLSVK